MDGVLGASVWNVPALSRLKVDLDGELASVFFVLGGVDDTPSAHAEPLVLFGSSAVGRLVHICVFLDARFVRRRLHSVLVGFWCVGSGLSSFCVVVPPLTAKVEVLPRKGVAQRQEHVLVFRSILDGVDDGFPLVPLRRVDACGKRDAWNFVLGFQVFDPHVHESDALFVAIVQKDVRLSFFVGYGDGWTNPAVTGQLGSVVSCFGVGGKAHGRS